MVATGNDNDPQVEMLRLSEPFPTSIVTCRGATTVLLAGLVAISLAGWLVYQNLATRPSMSVTAVVAMCKEHPSSIGTGWVEGYPVMAITPVPAFSVSDARAVSYGSLYSSAFVGRRQPAAGLRLVSGAIPGSTPDTSGPRLTLRLQGHTKMHLHGRVTCLGSPGLVPGLVVDATASA